MKVEGIQINDFNSVDEGLLLVERDAPLPEEKAVIEDIPYMQGFLDFSMLLGERVFNNRILSFEFISGKLDYRRRKQLENRVKRLIGLNNEARLYDTHNPGFYWLGKCISIEATDNAQFNKINFYIEFEVYPFMIRNKNHFDDVWDDFNFEVDVAGYTQFEVDGTRTITLYNAGDTTVRPNIIVEVEE